MYNPAHLCGCLRKDEWKLSIPQSKTVLWIFIIYVYNIPKYGRMKIVLAEDTRK